MGGVFECLVCVVKRELRESIGRRCLWPTQLDTVLGEAAAIINTRPLTACGSLGEGEALTPAHFLVLRSRQGLGIDCAHDDDDPDFNQPSLSKLWKVGQHILNQFWICWRNEYQVSLRHNAFATLRKEVPRVPQIGEVVLVKEVVLPRGRWIMGRITEITSSYGAVRSATVLQPSGKQLCRPVSLHFPLKCPSHPPSPLLQQSSP